MNISTLYFGNIGAKTGVSTVLKNLLDGFDKKKDITYSLYCLDVDGKTTEKNYQEIHQNNLKQRLKKVIHYLLNYLSKNFSFFAGKYAWLRYDRNAINIVNRYGDKLIKQDILFFQDCFTAYYFRKKYINIWESKKKVIVLHCDGNPTKMLFEAFPSFNTKTKNYYKQMSREVLGDSDAVVLLSNYSKGVFVNLFPNWTNKVFVVENGVKEISLPSTDSLIKISDKIKIVTVGTVCERKGHDIIVDTVIEMEEEQRNQFELYIIGDGIILPSLKEKCIRKNLKNINFIGKSSEVNRYLVGSDIYLQASRDEGLPMAIIEAMSFGLPIIGTRVGGIPDLIKKNGWLISPTKRELKEVILKIIEGRYNLEVMANESYALFKSNFTQDKMIDKYINIFSNL